MSLNKPPMKIRCNKCFTFISNTETYYITKCYHAFCIKDYMENVIPNKNCLVCNTYIDAKDPSHLYTIKPGLFDKVCISNTNNLLEIMGNTLKFLNIQKEQELGALKKVYHSKLIKIYEQNKTLVSKIKDYKGELIKTKETNQKLAKKLNKSEENFKVLLKELEEKNRQNNNFHTYFEKISNGDHSKHEPIKKSNNFSHKNKKEKSVMSTLLDSFKNKEKQMPELKTINLDSESQFTKILQNRDKPNISIKEKLNEKSRLFSEFKSSIFSKLK